MGELSLCFRSRAMFCVGAAIMVLGAFGAAGTERAQAQEVDCERVAYNEIIVLQCTTTGDQSGATPTAAPEPTSTPEPEATATPELTLTPEPEATATPQPEVTATVEPEDGADADADADADEDEDRVVEQSVESPDDPGDSQVDADDSVVLSNGNDGDVDRPAEDDSDQGATPLVGYDFDTTPDPVPDYRAAVVAIVGLTAVGAFLFLAARRTRRSTGVT